MDKLARESMPAGRVDLSREADFTLGPLRIRPSRLEVEAGGVRRVLQRRVMQVLVALAHSTSEVVSQRELILRCWDGLAVSDDAIARCIAQLRRLAAQWPTPPFEIETIAGVGYRLDAPEASPAWQTGTGLSRMRRDRRLAMAAIGGMALLAAAGIGLWTFGGAHSAGQATISIEPIKVLDGGPSASALANVLEDDISGTLNEAGVRTTPPRLAFPFLHADRPDLVFGGTVGEDAQVARVRLYLEDRRTRATLWSDELDGEAYRRRELADQAAAIATETVFEALTPDRQPGLRLNPHTLAFFIRAQQFLDSPEALHADDARRDLEQALQEAPDFAYARGTYALALMQEASSQPPGPERQRLMDLAASEANKAIRQSPGNAGPAFEALYGLQRLRDPTAFLAAERRIQDGLRQAPEFAFLQMRECQLLDEVGRALEALPFCQRAIVLRPMAAPIGWKYAVALYEAGEPQWADREMENSVRRYPAQEATRLARLKLAAFGQSPRQALPLLDGGATTPNSIPPAGLAALRLFVRARISGSPADASAAVGAILDAAAQDRLGLGLAVTALALMGHNEQALELLSGAPAEYHWGGGVQFMVDPSVAGLRSDPRYWAAARRFGLVRYWSLSGWPDFCGQPSPRIDCRALAAQSNEGRREG
jgi:DNA-binding winged helix-turn-helix (wHTH) protein